MAKVFISYSRRDIDFAKRLTGELKKSDTEFWIDWEGIPPTVDWWKEIEKAIEESDAFLFIISPDSAKSEVCGQEINHAIKNGKRLVPIVLREVHAGEIHPDLKPLNWIFFREADDFHASITKVLTSIRTDYDWVQTHRRLQIKALEWERNHRENSFLLRGKDLGDAELQISLNSSKEPYLTNLQRDYVFRSRKATDKQKTITIGISIAGLVVTTALAIYAFMQAKLATDKANIALARQLAAQAQALFATGNSKQMTAVLLAAQSMQIASTTDAVQILQDNILVAPVAHMIYESDILSVAFSPDGQYIVSGGCDRTDDDDWCVQGSTRVWEAATGREIARTTHGGHVLSVAFSPDGKYVISGSADHTARIIEIGTGREIAHVLHKNAVSTVAFSPDGKYVASAGCEVIKNGFCAFGVLRISEANSGREVIQMLHYGGSISTAIFSPDGLYIASAGAYPDSTVYIWNVQTGQNMARMIHGDGGGGVNSIAFSSDGRYIASAVRWSNTIRVWEVANGKELTRMNHDDVYSVAFSPDGKYIVSGSSDRTARIWDFQTGQEISRVQHDSLVHDVIFSPNGSLVATGSYDGTVRIWEPTTGREVGRITHQALVNSIAFSSDGDLIASAGCERRNENGYCQLGKASVWDVSPISDFNGPSGMDVARLEHDWFTSSIAFSPDGRFMISGSHDKTARVWDTTTWLEIARLHHDSKVSSVSFSSDGKFAVTVSQDGIWIWEVESWREIRHVVHGDSISFLSTSSDGQYIVFAGHDNVVRIMNAEDGIEIVSLSHSDRVVSIAFSLDKQYVVSGSRDNAIHIWRISDGREIVRIPYIFSINSVVFSPDGRYVVSTGCRQTDDLGNCESSIAQVWNARSGREISQISINGFPRFTQLSYDSAYAISLGSQDRALVMWDLRSGDEITRLPIENIAQSIDLSPDGRYIALAGCGQSKDVIFAEMCSSGIVQVWDTLSGQEVISFHQASTVLNAVFSPDGRYLAVADYDGFIRIKLYRPADLINQTCARVTRNLTHAEWNQYIGDASPYEATCSNLPIEPEPTLIP